MSQISHIALFASAEGGIQTTGASAEAAISAAVQATGAKPEDFTAKPVTPRMAMVLACGTTPSRWTVVDGVADLHDEDYKKAWFVFSELAGEDEEDRQLFGRVQHGEAIEAVTATGAILAMIYSTYGGDDWPGDVTYAAVEVPAGAEFDYAFVEVEDEVYRLAEAFEDAYWCEREVDEDDWDEFLYEVEGEDEEEEEDQVSLINECKTYDDDFRLITDSPIRLNGVHCAVVSVYRRHDETAFVLDRKVYPKIRKGQYHMGAQALRAAVEAEILRIEMGE